MRILLRYVNIRFRWCNTKVLSASKWWHAHVYIAMSNLTPSFQRSNGIKNVRGFRVPFFKEEQLAKVTRFLFSYVPKVFVWLLNVIMLLKFCTEKVNCMSQESSIEHEVSTSLTFTSQHCLLVSSLPAELLYEIRLISNWKSHRMTGTCKCHSVVECNHNMKI